MKYGDQKSNSKLEYGLCWTQFAGRDGRLVSKEKFFKSEAARSRFIGKLEESGNLYQIDGYHN